jgi:hypothetical protein
MYALSIHKTYIAIMSLMFYVQVFFKLVETVENIVAFFERTVVVGLVLYFLGHVGI